MKHLVFLHNLGWQNDIQRWCGKKISQLQLEGSFRLSYNASVFVKEGLGYQLTFKDLVDVSKDSGLAFRPLYHQLETKLYLIWNKYQKD